MTQSKLLLSVVFFILASVTQAATQIIVTWQPPTEREDGQPISASEISGYTLRCGGVITQLPPGDSYTGSIADVLPGYGATDCTLSAVDQNGLESQPSDPVTVLWTPGKPRAPTTIIIIAE